MPGLYVRPKEPRRHLPAENSIRSDAVYRLIGLRGLGDNLTVCVHDCDRSPCCHRRRFCQSKKVLEETVCGIRRCETKGFQGCRNASTRSAIGSGTSNPTGFIFRGISRKLENSLQLWGDWPIDSSDAIRRVQPDIVSNIGLVASPIQQIPHGLPQLRPAFPRRSCPQFIFAGVRSILDAIQTIPGIVPRTPSVAVSGRPVSTRRSTAMNHRCHSDRPSSLGRSSAQPGRHAPLTIQSFVRRSSVAYFLTKL